MKFTLNNSDTIAAVATAYGNSAIAIIRVSGSGSFEIARKLFGGNKNIKKIEPRYFYLSNLKDEKGENLDKVLFVCFNKPGSYTGEDMLEIHCHGGIFITNKVIERVLQLGARPAQRGEFTARAFENNKLDLTQAEAVMDLINAKTDLAYISAHHQLEGKFSQYIFALRKKFVNVLANVEAYIDFPEEDIEPESEQKIIDQIQNIVGEINDLLDNSKFGKILREGALCAIIGEPNVGKSSLLNTLMGYERAITSKTPGTTRDTIEEIIDIHGLPVKVIDTAGIRKSRSNVEQEGINRTKEAIKNADVVLHMFDGSQPKPKPQSIKVEKSLPSIFILNKCDKRLDSEWLNSDFLKISCKSGTGIENLKRQIAEKIKFNSKELKENPIAINSRHRLHLIETKKHSKLAIEILTGKNNSIEFCAHHLHIAIEHLGKIAGATESEEILDEIFSKFCIGK